MQNASPSRATDGERRPAVTTFGIVTPTLNAEAFLRSTLDSIWSQAADDIAIDHVLVDGGSTDRTVEIAEGYPTRVVVSTDDQGMYDAINRGLAMVSGSIVGYLNADDELTPGALAAVARALRSHPDAMWVMGRREYVDAEGRLLAPLQPVPFSLAEYVGMGWSHVPQECTWLRRELLERVGPFDISVQEHRRLRHVRPLPGGRRSADHLRHPRPVPTARRSALLSARGHGSRERSRAGEERWCRSVGLAPRTGPEPSGQCSQSALPAREEGRQDLVHRPPMSGESPGVQPIFLLSMPRSGSTLAQRVLARAPCDLHCGGTLAAAAPRLRAARDAASPPSTRSRSPHARSASSSVVCPGGERRLLAMRCVTSRSTCTRKAADARNATYFLDKTPRYHFIVPEICSHVPRCEVDLPLEEPARGRRVDLRDMDARAAGPSTVGRATCDGHRLARRRVSRDIGDRRPGRATTRSWSATRSRTWPSVFRLPRSAVRPRRAHRVRRRRAQGSMGDPTGVHGLPGAQHRAPGEVEAPAREPLAEALVPRLARLGSAPSGWP